MSENLNAQKKQKRQKQQKRIRELIDVLHEANRSYYDLNIEMMSNFEYDALYDELLKAEEESGLQYADSPTVRVGHSVVSELVKVAHHTSQLSLNKTKSAEDLKTLLGDSDGILSWKLDGLTIVLEYDGGVLKQALTRGNGEIGEDVTHNAQKFIGLPSKVAYKGRLTLRGEALITYSDFESINDSLGEESAKYKNPRNLCSGSVRQLDASVTAKRKVRFYAFALGEAKDSDGIEKEFKTRDAQFTFLETLGFKVVEHYKVNALNLEEVIEKFRADISKADFPSDGLVLSIDDLALAATLGNTSKFPKDSLAYKWRDETAVTTLEYIEWNPSRTGLINPIAVFSPVELEGTSVSRASVHNISIMRSLKLGIGDRLEVYKANMIIPQISQNLTKSDNFDIPCACPACGEKTTIKSDHETEVLVCENALCPAKRIGAFVHFVSRNAFNIGGLSEKTLEKFIHHGFIKTYADIFKLKQYRTAIENMEGFGAKSYERLMAAIEASRNISPDKFIYSMSINGIGLANARVLMISFDNDLDAMMKADLERLVSIPDIGEVLAASIRDYFSEKDNIAAIDALLKMVNIVKKDRDFGDLVLSGKTIVVTGSLNTFKSRDDFRDWVVSLGAKLSASVSAKTDFLVNNDNTSNSSKNKKAKELGVRIVTEEEFLHVFKTV